MNQNQLSVVDPSPLERRAGLKVCSGLAKLRRTLQSEPARFLRESSRAWRVCALAALMLCVLFPLAASAQWQIGQRAFAVPSGGGGTVNWSLLQSPGGVSCSAGSSCLINTVGSSMVATTANSVVLLGVYTSDSNTISSISFTGGCTGVATGTWSGGSGAGFAAFNSPTGGMILAYNLGNGGACTDITVNLTSAETGTWEIFLDEFSRGGGTPVIDALAATNTNTTSCTTCTGSSFTGLTGTSDLLVQAINFGGTTIGNPSSPYQWDPNKVFSYALNSTATAAPTWTQTSGGFQSLGVAFK